MQAAGAYLRALRVESGLTQDEVADRLRIADLTLRRWEQGYNRPGLASLTALLDLLKGQIAHFQQLLTDKKATADDGAELARRWIRERTLEQFDAESRAMTKTELRAAIEEFEAAVNYDEDILVAWRAFAAAWRKARPRPADERRRRGYRSGQRDPRPPDE